MGLLVAGMLARQRVAQMARLSREQEYLRGLERDPWRASVR